MLRRLGQQRCHLFELATAAPSLRPLSRARPSTFTRPKSTSSTKVDFDSLPSRLVTADGNPVGPLEAILSDAPKKRASKASKNGKKATEGVSAEASTPSLPKNKAERDYNEAVATGRIPDTPLAKLVWENWQRFPDCVLLTQVGNFFESYFEPAIELSGLLGIKLTKKNYRSGTFPFTGFPIHQIDKYLKLLVHDLGHTVVLVEEEKDLCSVPEKGADIVRKVARVVTPGTLLDESWISGGESRYLLAIAAAPQVKESEGTQIYLAYADVSTGEFFTKESSTANIEDELARIAPREVVLDADLRDEWLSATPGTPLLALLRSLPVYISFASPGESTSPPRSVHSLERWAISLLRHHLQFALRDNMPTMPENPNEFSRESESTQMHIDAATLQALEVRHALRPGSMPSTNTLLPWSSPLSMKGTLLSVLSRTVTDSGHRLLKRTLTAPSTSLPQINARLALVAAFVEREPLRTDVRDALRVITDVMRIVQRFRSQRGDGTDVWEIARWVKTVATLCDRIKVDARGDPARVLEGPARLQQLVNSFVPLDTLVEDIERAIDESSLQSLQQLPEEDISDIEEAPPRRKGGKGKKETQDRWWVRPEFSTELRDLHRRLGKLLKRRASLETELQKALSAPSLWLDTNIRGVHVVMVKKKSEIGKIERSPKFQSISELKSARVYICHEWTLLGADIDTTTEELEAAQNRAMSRLRMMIVEQAKAIQHNAELIDEIDLTTGFAQAAVDLNYVRPTLHEGTDMKIVNGRHPSVEAGLQASARVFTPNTTHMTNESHLQIITGPNQGGKSTLLRQTAVITILAQAGSFVPADFADVGIVDRVFSRIGARDDLFRDRSTFMLEMVETASILKNATPRSLIIMDEIGRGTTLKAGMSIAYATLNYILEHVGCRTLFATHYHELGKLLLTKDVPTQNDHTGIWLPPDGAVRRGVSFWCTDVDEMDGSFAYSYRLRPGINCNSHAIKAAQLAGMPESFLNTAEATLRQLDDSSSALLP